MACGSDSYPKTRDKNFGLLNNYHVSKQLMQATPVKEEVAFTQTSSDIKTRMTNKKG